jgi:hypothetical protein
MRDANGNNNWTLLDTITANSSPITVHDTNAVITANTRYRIEGNGGSCTPRSLYTIYSNVKTAQPNGITSIKSDVLEIYPNPTTGILHLSKINLHLTLSDITGQKIEEIFNAGSTLNISALSPGVYFLAAEHSVTKIVKL